MEFAPPKNMDKRSSGYYYSKDEKTSRKERRASLKPIEQKSLVKQLYYCYDFSKQQQQSSSNNEKNNHQKQQPAIGVEILEGSIMDLNPNNIRRMYSAGSSKIRTTQDIYPTKYATEGVADVDEANDAENVDEEEVATDLRQELNESEQTDNNRLNNTLENERTAPWNQYAWLEEMYLRVSANRLLSCVTFRSLFSLTLTSIILCR